jgi:hypothetical protein
LLLGFFPHSPHLTKKIPWTPHAPPGQFSWIRSPSRSRFDNEVFHPPACGTENLVFSQAQLYAIAMIKFAKGLVVSFSLLLAGCVSVSQEDIKAVDFGAKPSNYEERVKDFMAMQLKDPMSAVYNFRLPLRKAVVRSGMLDNFTKYYGWVVEVSVNAKNSFGGYTGAKTYFILIRPDGLRADITDRLKTGGWVAFVD